MATAQIRIIVFLVLGAIPLAASDIEGRVRAGGQGPDVIKRATIQLLHESLIAEERLLGSDGRFEFRNLARGAYTIRIRAEGYQEQEITVNLVRPTSRESIQVDLRPLRQTPEGAAETVSVAEYQIPNAAKREYQQGLEERKRGRCEKAVPHLQKAIAAFAKYGEAFNELGICFKQMGEPGKAEDSFKKAVEYSSTVYTFMNLADLYADQKRFADAHDVLRQSIVLHPSEGDPFFTMARIYFDQGGMEEARQAGLQAHQKMHRMADVHLLLAKVYLALKQYPLLVAQLELYLDENPKGPVADRVRKNLEELGVAGGRY